MSTPLPIWRRLWVGLPLAYKLVLLGLCTVMTVTAAVMVVTFVSAGEGLKLQMERQLSRDLNVVEAWYRTRLEEIQLTAVALARQPELGRAVASKRLAPAEALLIDEERRLALDLAVVVGRDGRLVGLSGAGGRFDPHGLVGAAIASGEQLVVTEALEAADQAALAVGSRAPGLVRLVVTPIGPPGGAVGALVLGERVDADTAIPRQITALIGGAVAVLDHRRVIAQAGFPEGAPLQLNEEVWGDVRGGRYFFAEQPLGGREYLIAFRPIVDHQGRPVGAIARAFPEDEISETLLRYAGGIALLASAAVLFALVAFFLLTRRLLFPLRRLALLSAGLAEGDGASSVVARVAGHDEIASVARGVVKLADRLTQSREELAAAAVKLEAEALELAARNAQLARLDAERTRLLDQIRDHDRLRGQLIERIISAQEDERKRLARELHDQTGQSLTSLLVGLKVIEGSRTLDDLKTRTTALKQLTVQMIEEVHQLSLALRPAMLDDLGLMVALRSLVQDFGKQHGIAATFQADPLEQRLPAQYEVTLYRIAQEALTNVAKYASARTVQVTFRLAEGRFILHVADDGRGFDPGAVGTDGREHLGILGMRERVALIAGELQIDTKAGGGTRVTVSAALPAASLRPTAAEPEVPYA